MRRVAIAVLACLPALSIGASPSAVGRWEGSAHIPGKELQLVVDLAPDRSGAWSGSIIVPGLGIKGAPLSNIVVTDTAVTFDVPGALGGEPYGPARFKADLIADARMKGEMAQAGNRAEFFLAKVGPPQVESPLRSTRVGRELEARWSGEFELGGYPRQITITLENHADRGASATFVVVGKRTTELPVDLVLQDGAILRVESQANQVVFEGRIDNDRGEIRGTIELGSTELPLVLRRVAGSAS
jgi:hypothetical protein